MRRLALTGGLVLISDGSVLQILTASLIALASLCVYSHTRPYEKEAVDTLAITAQLIIFVQLFAALLIRTEILQMFLSQGAILALLVFVFFFIIGVQIIDLVDLNSFGTRCDWRPSTPDATTTTDAESVLVCIEGGDSQLTDAQVAILTEEACRFVAHSRDGGANVVQAAGDQPDSDHIATLPRHPTGNTTDNAARSNNDDASGTPDDIATPPSNAGHTTEIATGAIRVRMPSLRRGRERLAARKAQIAALAHPTTEAAPSGGMDDITTSSTSPEPGDEIEMTGTTHDDVEHLGQVNPMHAPTVQL
jgi:hypothetical protein